MAKVNYIVVNEECYTRCKFDIAGVASGFCRTCYGFESIDEIKKTVSCSLWDKSKDVVIKELLHKLNPA